MSRQFNYEFYRILGYSELDVEHIRELHRLCEERDAKGEMKMIVTQREMDLLKDLRLDCSEFEVFEPFKRNHNTHLMRR